MDDEDEDHNAEREVVRTRRLDRLANERVLAEELVDPRIACKRSHAIVQKRCQRDRRCPRRDHHEKFARPTHWTANDIRVGFVP
jgi:hypothetical protein